MVPDPRVLQAAAAPAAFFEGTKGIVSRFNRLDPFSLPRQPRRLVDRLEAMMKALEAEYGARRRKDDAAGAAKEEKVDPEARAEIDRIR